MNCEHIIDKRLVRNAFERAATSYDQAAALQREVCDRMMSRLDRIKYIPRLVLDAGSGTGYGTRKLRMRYPTARILAVDYRNGDARSGTSSGLAATAIVGAKPELQADQLCGG